MIISGPFSPSHLSRSLLLIPIVITYLSCYYLLFYFRNINIEKEGDDVFKINKRSTCRACLGIVHTQPYCGYGKIVGFATASATILKERLHTKMRYLSARTAMCNRCRCISTQPTAQVLQPAPTFRIAYPTPAGYAAVPVAVPIIAVSALALLANAKWIAAKAIGAFLGTKVEVDGLVIRPFRGVYGVRGFRLFDPRGRPMLSATGADVAIRGGTAKQRSREYDCTITQPEVCAIFDNYAFTESNWSLFAQRFTAAPDTEDEKKNGNGIRRPQPDSRVNGARPEEPVPSPSVHVRIVDGIRLSVRSEVLQGARLIDDVRLDDIEVSAADFRSRRAVAGFVEGLAAKAIKSTSSRSIPREVRQGARRYARAVLSRETVSIRHLSRIRIKRLRKRIGIMDRYLLQDMPDLQQVSSLAKASQTALETLERLLRTGEASSDDEGDEQDLVIEQPTSVMVTPEVPLPTNPSEQTEEGDEIQKSPPPPLYRELDEDWKPKSVTGKD